MAINIWAVSLLGYSGEIIRWNKDDLLEMHRHARKLMTMNGAFHPKSDINRIHIPRKRGGRGLISAESCIRREKNSMGWCVKHSVELFLDCVRAGNIIETADCIQLTEYKRIEEEKERIWREKKMCGQFARDHGDDVEKQKS